MRSLGLTIKEIQEFAAQYVAGTAEPIGPCLQHKLSDASTRIGARIAELQAVRERIHAFQSAHAAELAGRAELSLVASDPRRVISKIAS